MLGLPLGASALVSSLAVWPIVLAAGLPPLGVLAGGLFWLAAIWLVLAWTYRRPALFSAHQAVLALAVLAAVAAWLRPYAGTPALPIELVWLQGLGLALLTSPG